MGVTFAMNLTPTQLKLYGVLKDGESHSMRELLSVLDSYTSRVTVRVHLCMMRKTLRAEGQDIICEIGQTVSYRLIEILPT